MAIKVSGITVIDDNRNISGSTLTATRLDVKPVPITFSPAIGANVINTSNIIITFDQPVSKGTGNITLRSGSAGGTVLQTIGVSSSIVTISGGVVTIDPPENIDTGITTFVVVDAGAFIGLTTTSTSALIDTYSFTTASLTLGSSYEGGYLICGASPLRWVVSPYSAEVSRNWASRNDANTRAQSVSGCTGWFVPTKSQLQNPGYLCRSFWGPSPSCSNAPYWAGETASGENSHLVSLSDGGTGGTSINSVFCVRSFRCVTY